MKKKKKKKKGVKAGKIVTVVVYCEVEFMDDQLGESEPSDSVMKLDVGGDVVVVELSSTEQEIHAVVTPNHQDGSWLLSVVYSSPCFAKRRLLWENLSSVAGLHSLPWVVAGDFNEVLMGEDKYGGRPVNISRALHFQECLDTCRLIDIGFSGSRFTWSNHRLLTDLIQERIDRVFVNAKWNSIYPEANVKHLERVQSDHCHILVCLKHRQQVRLQRPFRFQLIWLSHPEFPNIVRKA
ncbi:uncharacterized protein LOC142630676 [Castanea sativa]|uniref:uncharacterized protein LOC142630676 n=1 Tax=Castanea sativa TaxID=21020 RepID=UPI003F6519EF